MPFTATFSGFKTRQQALEFIKWYEGGGEQQFYEHLQILGKSPNDGCNVDVSHKGNTGRYWDEHEDDIKVNVQ